MSAVLVLRVLGLGDFLSGVPAYRALRTAFTDHEIVLAAPRPLEPLIELTGAVDRLLPTWDLAPLPWRGAPPRVAVDLHGNGPVSRQLIATTGASVRMGFGAPGVPGPGWEEHEHEVARWCRLLEWWGIPADPADLDLAPPPVPSPLPGATVIHPGASSGSRRWPAERFAATAEALEADGHKVVITAGTGESALARHVAETAGLPTGRTLTGLDTGRLAALVAQAQLVISGDTGVARLAFAYARPSVTFYGPVSPVLRGPPRRPVHHTLWHGSVSRPSELHTETPDPALLRVTPQEVLSVARSALHAV
ncbi:glycosyltransferase family 9 protein [Actinocorallia sp. API 0066]|uniref:glycosyltransferase family 9 protein n=1 Tax=Actinocorallia sp. API 0066 TaxID=2896846 RepID=UPI001E373912|nr:glycosyltransferase family 9 protein [Actinocorallia sp. API 0066]MCD0451589.1 glycosyltransferase family 9 protein [Actinocorallia sp. API 0066]